MQRSKVLEKAKKLKALADRGVGGEKTNAKVMYEAFIKKHNITESELNACVDSVDYLSMSDEEFLKEMALEVLPVGLGYIFSKLFKDEALAEELRDKVNKVGVKFGNAMADRVNSKQKK